MEEATKGNYVRAGRWVRQPNSKHFLIFKEKQEKKLTALFFVWKNRISKYLL